MKSPFLTYVLDIMRKSSNILRGYTFFNKESFHKRRQVEIGKKSRNTKPHPEAELWLFENYSHSSSMLSSEKKKKKQVCLFSWDYKTNHIADHIDTTKAELSLDMDTNKVNTKSVSVWWCLHDLSKT